MKTKLYGKKSKVCYKHRSNIGAAVVRFGKCTNCSKDVNTGGGALPVLCDGCSVSLNICKYCND